MVERIYRRLKEALKTHGGNWIKSLPTVLLALQAAPREGTGVTAAEITFGSYQANFVLQKKLSSHLKIPILCKNYEHHYVKLHQHL